MIVDNSQDRSKKYRIVLRSNLYIAQKRKIFRWEDICTSVYLDEARSYITKDKSSYYKKDRVVEYLDGDESWLANNPPPVPKPSKQK